MSNQYFASYPEDAGTPPSAGYGPGSERPYGYGSSLGEAPDLRDARATHYQQFSPHVDPRPVQAQRGFVRRRQTAILAVVAAIAVGSGGYSVVSQAHFGAMQAKADEPSASLTKAQEALAGKDDELNRALQERDASASESARATEAAEAATVCASYLMEAWDAYFREDFESAQASIDAAAEPCQVALGSGEATSG